MTIKLSSLKKRNQFKKRLSPPTVGIVSFVGNDIVAISDNQPFFEFLSGSIGPDGNVYCFPYNNNIIIKIDTNTGHISTIDLNPLTGYASTTLGYGCSGSVLAQNNKIYTFAPRQSVGIETSRILEYDVITNTVEKIGVDTSFNSRGLCLHPNGKIYSAPFGDKILVIDPDTKTSTVEEFGTVAPLGSNFNWAGTVLGPNGKMYGIPYESTSVLEIDPIAGIATTFGNLSGSSKWWGGVLAPNGKIYGIPDSSTSVLEIDPINRTVSTFGNYSFKGFNGFLGQDGKIYVLPYNTNEIVKIDPDAKTITSYYIFSESQTIGVGILAENGNVYCPPSGNRFNGLNSTTNRVLKIGIGAASKPSSYILGPYQNNF